MKKEINQEAFVKRGTTFDISGYPATCTRILREGVEIELQGQTYTLDFEKIEFALFGDK